MVYKPGTEVTHVQTGTPGIVQEDGQTVSWEPNVHGGYISRPEPQEVHPNDCTGCGTCAAV